MGSSRPFCISTSMFTISMCTRKSASRTTCDACNGFFHEAGIPLGIIIWSGYDPLNADRAYYDHAMDLAGQVKAAIGMPDHLVFQSWVTRAPVACAQSEPACLRQGCSPDDPPYCGEKSVPLNLPDDDPAAFTQTRLVRAVLSLFGEP